MPFATTVPQAKAALKALLESHTFPGDQPLIKFGGPTENEDMSQLGELIYFGGTEIEDESPTLGDTRIDETFSLRVVIDVLQYGDDELAAETRAWALYDELVSLVVTNKTLTGTVQRTEGRTVRQTNVPLPQQWLSRIIVDQSCVGMVFNP